MAEGHAINLSGLTAEEAQALFLVAGPELLAGLGIEQGLTSALRKLLAALPETTRRHADLSRGTIHIDASHWGQPAEHTPPALAPLRAAVVAGLQVDLTYAKPGEDATVRRVHPYGLVSKNGIWYLVAGTEAGLRTFRASRVVAATTTEEPVDRPDDFDLSQAWDQISHRMPYLPRVRIELEIQPAAMPAVTSMFGPVYQLEPLDGDSTANGAARRLAATFPSIKEAACDLIYLREGVRVLGPPAVREELHRIACILAASSDPYPVTG